MADVFFPQLISGSLVQYPINKERSYRTIRNLLMDGRIISFPDSGASSIRWTLNYTGLTTVDTSSLKALFDACEGPLRPFTFIDPTSNILSWSCDLKSQAWQRSPLLSITAGIADPNRTSEAFQIINEGQNFQELSQTVAIPTNYQYCLSLYALGVQSESLVLFRRGPQGQVETSTSIGTQWTRMASEGRLNDAGSVLTVGFRIAPGQSVTIYGPQLEAQKQMSPYRKTTRIGGVFSNCFLSSEEMIITADAPGSFSTVVDLETAA